MFWDPQHLIPFKIFHDLTQDYPETGYTNTSWWRIRELMLLKAEMVPWRKRHRNVFMRHFGGVGYRKTLLPVLIVGR